jgi:gliding motility-associated protein GldC
MSRQSQIELRIELDENNIPENIRWQSNDQVIAVPQEAKAMMLALWDKQTRNGMSIDLWTKEMTIEEMNIFVFQTLMTMSDTFERATRNSTQAIALKNFATEFLKNIQQTPASQK